MRHSVALAPLLGFALLVAAYSVDTRPTFGFPSVRTASATPAPVDPRLHFVGGFHGSVIAKISGARELAMLPSGDMLVGTRGNAIVIVPNADGPGSAGVPQTFIALPETPAESIVYAPNGALYAATNTNVWKIPYKTGDRSESSAVSIARVRTGPVAPHSDGDVHSSTSLAATAWFLYASVGSSCNACVEVDPTRASVQRMRFDGSGMTPLAQRVRNAIALTVDPFTQTLWMGGAGQDNLPYGHPYEYLDSPQTHGGMNVDYGWPQCEENHLPYNALQASPPPNCANSVAPAIEFPAYATLVGAAFYRGSQKGAYVFPSGYRNGVFVTSHGSWHCCPSTPPRVYYVPMNNAASPVRAVDWSNPGAQSVQFVSGYGSTTSTSYIDRPTGVAVGLNGSLFVSNTSGQIVRIRYN